MVLTQNISTRLYSEKAISVIAQASLKPELSSISSPNLKYPTILQQTIQELAEPRLQQPEPTDHELHVELGQDHDACEQPIFH